MLSNGEIETLFYQALREPVGLVIQTNFPEEVLRKLYVVRKTQAIFEGLEIRRKPQGEIWLVNKRSGNGTQNEG